jgi:ABC-type oligopeptide transport system ATPase subunit
MDWWTASKMTKIKVEVKNLKKYFYSGVFRKKVIKAVDGVSFEIKEGKTLGLVGESGCGKTTVGRTILRLINPTEGKIIFDGGDITSLNGSELKKFGRVMQIIFQNPESSLNPRMKIFDSIAEPLSIHKICNKNEEKERIFELIETVNLNEELLFRYPHELSGGQIQRVVIARILSLNPKFIVADEPTSMLDVSVQAQILNLLKDLQKKYGLSYLFISHDLEVVEWMSDEIAIMHKGKIVERK